MEGSFLLKLTQQKLNARFQYAPKENNILTIQGIPFTMYLPKVNGCSTEMEHFDPIFEKLKCV